jgi:hypothetical protein
MMTEQPGEKPRILHTEDLAGTDDFPLGALLVGARVPGLPGWDVELVVPLSGEAADIVAELRLRPAFDHDVGHRVVPSGGIQAATLRALPLASILREAFQPGPPGSIGWFMNAEYP